MALISGRMLIPPGTTSLETIADLRALTTTPDVVFIQGHTTTQDGGGGIFELLVPDGGTPGDIGAGGHDDDGAHIVCPATGAVYGRTETHYTPQMFGVIAAQSETDAASGNPAIGGTDQHFRMDRWLDFVLDPHGYSGWAYRGNQVHSIDGYVPDGFYRCEQPLIVNISGTTPLQAGGVVGEIVFHGRVWTPVTIQTQGIILRGGRRAGKPRMVLRAVKQKQGSGKVKWDGDAWPDLYRDSAAYRAWAGVTAVYAGEDITQLLGSGATALYRVTVSGTTGAVAPTDVTGNTFANGTATLQYLGTIRNASGQSCHDMLRKCRDIGVHIEHANEWHDLVCETEGYTIGIALWPRGDSGNSCGFVHVDGNHYGCKIGALVAHWFVDQAVANQAAMLALTGLPVGYIVRRADDVVNDWIFNGPLGGEAVLGNWGLTPVRNQFVNWCNENFFTGGVNYYAYGTGSFIDPSRGIYGIVFTAFEPSTYADTPSHTVHEGLAVEYAGKTNFGEMVNVLVDYGWNNEVRARNDQESHPVAIFCRHVDISKEPTRNVVITPRAGKWTVNDPPYRRDESNGRGNRVIQVGGRSDSIKTYRCNSLFADASFSSYDRVYFRETSTYSPTDVTYGDTQNNWLFIRQVAPQPATTGAIFHAEDLSFTFDYRRAPCVMVEIPDAYHRGRLIIEVEGFLANTAGAFYWPYMAIYDPLTGLIGNFSARPRVPLTGGNYGISYVGQSGDLFSYRTTTGNLNLPIQISPEPWIRKMLIIFDGAHLTGFQVRVLEGRGASIYSPANRFHKIPEHTVDAAPERGIWRSPTRLLLAGQDGANKWLYLNKADSQTEYWATSDAVADIVAPVKYQWGHTNGGADVQEWDGAAWNTIATGVSTTEPTDWVAEA